jgi:hypothetical protein
MTSDQLVREWSLSAQQQTLEERIQAWEHIVTSCENALRETDSTATIVFNEAILKIARLELLLAVTEKMKQ